MFDKYADLLTNNKLLTHDYMIIRSSNFIYVWFRKIEIIDLD